ncbi:MAG: hypothetical protein R3F49_21025 [Planctomycetota bacterium]
MTLVQPRLARVAEGLAPEVLGKLRVLHTSGATVLAARGLDLLASYDGGVEFERIARAWQRPTERALALAPIAARLLRAGIHSVLPMPDGGHVAVVRGAILRCEATADRFQTAHHVARGTRPLNLCRAASGRLYFGEYFGNARRDEVYIYGSDDGRAWSVAHVFPRGSIRHVHGVVYDRFRRGLWVMTGDEGDEAGIWWTSDEFRTLTPVARGFQGARAVSALPAPAGLIVPSDAPTEANFIQMLDPRTGGMERLAYVPGSVFTVGQTRALYLVSTALEPSPINLDPRVALYASLDGEDWHPIARFERDLAFLNDLKGRLQYPMVLLPDGELDDGSVLATGQSLAGLHGRLIRWDEAHIVAHLAERAPARELAPTARLAG